MTQQLFSKLSHSWRTCLASRIFRATTHAERNEAGLVVVSQGPPAPVAFVRAAPRPKLDLHRLQPPDTGSLNADAVCIFSHETRIWDKCKVRCRSDGLLRSITNDFILLQNALNFVG
jgi:hypothetical protein